MTPNADLREGRAVPVADGVVLDVATCGPDDGTPVMLLHGFPASRASFAPVARLLAGRGLRVVAPDQRGYSPGARPTGEGAHHVDRLVEDVLALLDAHGHESVHLVGHDWGAVVAWAVAARHPERLRSLTALSVPHPAALAWARAHDPDQQEGSAYIDLLVMPGKAERVLLEDGARRLRAMFPAEMDPALVTRHVDRLTEPGALTGALGWYRDHDHVLDELPAVGVDTTLVWGAEDPALRRAAVERCERHVTGGYRFVELPGAGHWLPELNADVVAAEVLRHVDSEPDRGTVGSPAEPDAGQE